MKRTMIMKKAVSLIATFALAATVFAGASFESNAYTETNLRSVYTNEPTTAAKANLRPIAVMMPTDKVAHPSYGIS